MGFFEVGEEVMHVGDGEAAAGAIGALLHTEKSVDVDERGTGGGERKMRTISRSSALGEGESGDASQGST